MYTFKITFYLFFETLIHVYNVYYPIYPKSLFSLPQDISTSPSQLHVLYFDPLSPAITIHMCI